MKPVLSLQATRTTPTPIEPDELLAFRAGDESALAQIYDRFGEALYRYLHRLVGPFEAEDLLQDLFGRLMRSETPYVSQGTLSAWLYRIASSLAIDRLRRRNRYVEEELDDSIVTDPTPSALDNLLTQERGEAIRGVVEKLPPAMKVVVVLRFWEDKSLQDISTILEIPEGTVKSRLHYALDRLSLSLEAWR